MLIVGAKGFAKEVLQICHQNDVLDSLVFYDDVTDDMSGKLYDQFPVLKSIGDAKEYLTSTDNRFIIAVGNPLLRKQLYQKFVEIGGKFTSTISRKADIGSYGVVIGEGCNILDGVKISNDVWLGRGSLVYYNSVITHDCKVGDFVEISPAANILGRVEIGNYTRVGANATILPNLKIGNNVTIGAGAVVIKDLPDDCTAVGVPAKIIKQV